MANLIPQAFPNICNSEKDALAKCIDRAWLTEGPECSTFRQSMCDLTGSRHVMLAPNGTLGLFLALLALDLPRGSEIVIPGFTFMASASAAVFAGLKPVLIDVDPDTFAATPEAFERAITPKTSALMPVHIYGQAAWADEIAQLGRQRGLKVIEDAAQACGVHYRNRHAGTFGDIGVISFFGDKSVTMGEGAALLVQSDALAEKIALLRNQGRATSGTFIHPALGMNFRVTDLQCAIGNVQLGKLDDVRKDRLRRYERYTKNLIDIPDIRLMSVHPDSSLLPFRFILICKNAAKVMQNMEAEGVQARSLFYPLSRQPCLHGIIDPVVLPVSDSLFANGVCLPIHHGVTDDDVDHISDIVRRTLLS